MRPDDLHAAEAAALRAHLEGAWRVSGRFAIWSGPGMLMTAPLAMARAPQRATLASCAERPLGEGARPPSVEARRAVQGARQALWRAIGGQRGLAPAVRIEAGEGAHAVWVRLWVAALDGAALAPSVGAALHDVADAVAQHYWRG